MPLGMSSIAPRIGGVRDPLSSPSSPGSAVSQLLQQLGGGSSSSATSGSSSGSTSTNNLPTTSAPVVNNKAQTDPNVAWLINSIKGQAGQDNTQRAMDMATSQIRDAGAGLQKQLGASAAMRGIGGTGAEGLIQQNLGRSLQGQIGQAAANIQLQRQQQLDNLLTGATGAFATPGSQAIQSQQLALAQSGQQNQQAMAAQQLALQQQQQNFQQQQAILQMLSNLYG